MAVGALPVSAVPAEAVLKGRRVNTFAARLRGTSKLPGASGCPHSRESPRGRPLEPGGQRVAGPHGPRGREASARCPSEGPVGTPRTPARRGSLPQREVRGASWPRPQHRRRAQSQPSLETPVAGAEPLGSDALPVLPIGALSGLAASSGPMGTSLRCCWAGPGAHSAGDSPRTRTPLPPFLPRTRAPCRAGQ